jgi:predicted phosphodiesterase
MSAVGSVALLSDVHGVLPVLEAVLAEPDVRAADLVVVAGDHASGPMPVETLDTLTGLGDRVRLVRGNADRELVDVARGGRSEHAESQWAAHQLRSDHVDLLAGLPHPVSMALTGFGPAVFCHGTPRDDEEVVLVDSRLERWADVFSTLPADVAIVGCGHTHMPFVRLVDRRIVVNPGSIGMPYGRAGGAWALLREGQVSLRHTSIDADAVCARIEAESGYPDRVAWAAEYVRSANSDADAIRAFAPRDGRDDHDDRGARTART